LRALRGGHQRCALYAQRQRDEALKPDLLRCCAEALDGKPADLPEVVSDKHSRGSFRHRVDADSERPALHVGNSADSHFSQVRYVPLRERTLGGLMQGPGSSDLSRRDVLKLGVAATAAPLVAHSQQQAVTAPVVQTLTLNVNGKAYPLKLDTRTTLLDALREQLQLTGSKKGCDHGQCGACTVWVDGRRINSCLTLAVMHDGQKVTTIEGLGTPAKMHPMQAAFVKHDGFQCGYCTPGQICSAVAVLREIQQGIPSHVSKDLNAKMQVTQDEIRERMSGNICRCGAYSNIVEAITEVAQNPGKVST
jgi:xanthine dehydrogenase YagT iron-sulfur-binding subunit